MEIAEIRILVGKLQKLATDPIALARMRQRAIDNPALAFGEPLFEESGQTPGSEIEPES